MFSYSDMNLFLSIAKAGSFTAAAKSLHTTQSAVSRRLIRLEQEVGCRLLSRSQGGRQIVLTPSGRAFLTIAERYIELWTEAQALPQLNLHINFTLETSGAAGEYLLPQVLHRFMGENPNILLSVRHSDSRQCYERVAGYRADMGIVTEEQYHPNMETHPIFSEPMVLLANRAGPLRSGMTPWELNTENEIFVPWNAAFSQWHTTILGGFLTPAVSVWTPHVARPFFSDPNAWMILPLSIARIVGDIDARLTWYPLEQGPDDQVTYYILRAGERSELTGRFLRFLAQTLSEVKDIRLLLNKEI